MKRIITLLSLLTILFAPFSGSGVVDARELPIEEKSHVLNTQDFTCSNSECLSKEVVVTMPFQAIAFEWYGDSHIQARLNEGAWSSWYEIEGEKDAPDTEALPPNAQMLMTSRALGFQIKTTNPAPGRIIVKVFNTPQLSRGDFKISVNEQPSDLAIVPRTQWLAGIELPWERRSTDWPTEYDTAKKIIIHHTATVVSDVTGDGVINGADYQQTARSIYSYHANSRRWGDIGYNYLIDPTGTIWEGREGGDGVEAGHAFRDNSCKKFSSGNVGFNQGTIGIALIGSFNADSMTSAARAALTSLIAKKSWEFGIDPSGSSFFKDQVYSNVIGHRDVDCTECPGNNVYNEFAGIIAEAKQKYDQLLLTTPRTVAAQIIDVSPKEVDIKAGEEKIVTITAKNTGTTTWRNYGENPVQVAVASIKEQLASLDSLTIASEGKDETISANSNQSSVLVVAKLKDPNVPPGQTGTFTFPIKDIPAELISKKKFVMTLGRLGWFSGTDTEVTLVNNGLELAALLDTTNLSSRMLDDTKTPITLSFKNKGTMEWKKGDIKLQITNSGKTTSSLKDVSWKKPDGQFDFVEKTVKPGETATFKVNLYGKTLGGATQSLALYNKKNKITGSDYNPLVMTVNPGYAAEVVSHSIPAAVQVGWQPTVAVTIKNIGSLPWDKAALMAYAKNGSSTSVIRASTWKSATVIDRTGKVQSGETATFLFKIKAPTKVGTYEQQLVMKQGAKTMYIAVPDGAPQKSLPLKLRVDKPAKKK